MAEIMPWLLSGLGLLILLLAGDSLVKGAGNLSLRLGVPDRLVGDVVQQILLVIARSIEIATGRIHTCAHALVCSQVTSVATMNFLVPVK